MIIINTLSKPKLRWTGYCWSLRIVEMRPLPERTQSRILGFFIKLNRLNRTPQ